MIIYQLSPGAGPMYCGNCLRDNALVAALRHRGHQVLMVPLYLPLTLDEPDQSAGTPIFFSGINVYLEQKHPFFRRAPAWLHRWLASPRLLRWAAGKAAKTRASEVGDLTLSMLQGELGNQNREIDDLLGWLRGQPRPDLVFLSNSLLLGMGRRLKAELGAPIVCMLQGEDSFLDNLAGDFRTACWHELKQRAAEVDLFIPATKYFADLMTRRLDLRPEQLCVVPNGINLDGYPGPDTPPRTPVNPPVIGFFARMCREKGLDTLVKAYLVLRRRGRVSTVRLHVGGSCGPADEPLVRSLRADLAAAGLLEDVEIHPNLSREQKLKFLEALTVFSVPALYGEAFGLYVVEALAAGVPVVQPQTAAFPELIEATGGGLLCRPGDPQALAEALEHLLLDLEKARQLGLAGRQAVFEEFSADRMAEKLLSATSHLVSAGQAAPTGARV